MKEGFDFLLQAFNQPGFLEDLTGLAAMHNSTLEADVSNMEKYDYILLNKENFDKKQLIIFFLES